MTARSEPSASAGQQPTLEELRALAVRYQTRLEGVRERLARQLHDDLTQKMTVASLELSLLDGSMACSKGISHGELHAKIQQLSALVRSMITGVRQIQTELRPKVLDEFGLVAALKWDCQSCQKETGLAFSIVAQPENIPLPPPVATELYRIFQEIVSN